jgi:hypothetical protein
MIRLRRIDDLIELHRGALEFAWLELAAACEDGGEFEQLWTDVAAAWDFDEVNDLIARHNRWYPVESRLPMDPKRRDYALVNGRDYRRARLGAAWVLQEFPARREDALALLRRSGTPARAS